ncbi:MAG: hypothetical protein GWN58_57285, partial [Anaerolineae bacterium]|nr:hypothetical protein [Anaerolineae bacterium]
MNRLGLPKLFQRLRWKLTFSYTAVTVGVLLTLVAVGLLGGFFFSPASDYLNHYLELAADRAAGAIPFLEAPLPEPALTEAWLKAAVPDVVAVILDPSGKVVAANPQESAAEPLPEQPFSDPEALDESRQVIDEALGGKPAVLGLDDGTIVASAPILGEREQVLGALYLRRFEVSLLRGWNLGA